MHHGGGQDIILTAATVHSDAGGIALATGRDLTLDVGNYFPPREGIIGNPFGLVAPSLLFWLVFLILCRRRSKRGVEREFR